MNGGDRTSKRSMYYRMTAELTSWHVGLVHKANNNTYLDDLNSTSMLLQWAWLSRCKRSKCANHFQVGTRPLRVYR